MCFWWRRKIEVSMNWKIESSFIESRLESSSLAPWVPRGDVFSRRKASFSEHERLGVFEILGLGDKRGHVQEKHDSVLALCSGERIAQVPRNERKRMSREGNKKKTKTYFLGRRDVVDIGPERQRHGERDGQFDTVTKQKKKKEKSRRHSRRTAVS